MSGINAAGQKNTAYNKQVLARKSDGDGGGDGDGTPKQQAPDDGNANRFDQNARESMASAFMGLSTVDMLRNATQGQEDIPKRIKMAIRRQYFSQSQTFHWAFFSFCVGAGIATLVYVYTFDAIDYQLISGEATNAKLAFFFGGMWLTSWMASYETRGSYFCSKKDKFLNKGVDQNKQGMPCYDDADCTVTEKFRKDACAHPSKWGPIKLLRDVFYWGTMIATVILGIVAAATPDSRGATAEEGFISFVFGMMLGVLWMFTFA